MLCSLLSFDFDLAFVPTFDIPSGVQIHPRACIAQATAQRDTNRGIHYANAGAAGRVALARFFAEALAVQAPALERAIVDGAESVNATDAVLAA